MSDLNFENDITKKHVFRFVILIGIVSLFADMTYEGARSITGPYLATLGANAAIVGFVAGFGELIGYALRYVSGYIADRTGKYWTITIAGYVINLFAVPLLALADQWWMAATLMIVERMGKAIRVPPRDAMLSHAGQQMGMGWVFGLHETMDKTGAMLGPLMVAAVLYFKGSYQQSFAMLLIPTLLTIGVLLSARYQYPNPKSLEIAKTDLKTEGTPSLFWNYVLAAAFVAAGYADFSLIAYHFQKTRILEPTWIPLFYSLAMGVNMLTAPVLGRLYDRYGFSVLIIVTILSLLFAPMVFLGNVWFIFIGIGLWSTGVGAHESLMRAIIANMISADKRASAYGIFNLGFGVFWFLGSVLMGVLYDVSVTLLVMFSVIVQLIAIPLLFAVMKKLNLNVSK